jgi:hypothetical protein
MLVVLAVTAMPAPAQKASGSVTTSRLTCPQGYYMLGEICISNGSGDVVLASRK